MYKIKGKITIAIDFDGTIVEHKYPKIGDPVPYAIDSIKKLKEMGHTLILYTMRGSEHVWQGNIRDDLQTAIDFCKFNGLKFDYYNENPNQLSWTNSPKVYADLYIDDAALGCPLIESPDGRDFVDWVKVMRFLGIEI